MADLLLGVDGGGSKTTALVAGPGGAVLGRGFAGSSNYQSVGFAAATEALDAAVAAALQAAGEPEARLAAACFGLAGAGRPADVARFETWLRERRLAPRWSVTDDAHLVLAAGTRDGWGLALICGTGSICYGRAPDGRTARAGGWGHLIGDEGSGYAVAVAALRLATQTADGRASAAALLQAVLDEWQLAEPRDLVGFVYHPNRNRAEIAALAGRVAALAETGDPDARALLVAASEELGRMLAAVTRALDLHEPPVALGGGFIGASPMLQRGVHMIAGVSLGPVAYVPEPAQGALALARRLLV